MFSSCPQFIQIDINQILYTIGAHNKIHEDFDLGIGLLVYIELNLIQEIPQS